jgi:hypothetical protein
MYKFYGYISQLIINLNCLGRADCGKKEIKAKMTWEVIKKGVRI